MAIGLRAIRALIEKLSYTSEMIMKWSNLSGFLFLFFIYLQTGVIVNGNGFDRLPEKNEAVVENDSFERPNVCFLQKNAPLIICGMACLIVGLAIGIFLGHSVNNHDNNAFKEAIIDVFSKHFISRNDFKKELETIKKEIALTYATKKELKALEEDFWQYIDVKDKSVTPLFYET